MPYESGAPAARADEKNVTAEDVFGAYIDRQKKLDGLPELRAVIKKFAPNGVLIKINGLMENCGYADGADGGLYTDGFVNFRLGPVKAEIEAYIDYVINCLLEVINQN